MKTIIRLLALACFAGAVPLVPTGCSTRIDPEGVYAGNSTLYATDASINAAFSVLDVFVNFQHENRANLPPEVNAFADKARVEAPRLAKSILALRDVYAAAPTAANKNNLEKALRMLRELVSQSALYLVEKPQTP